MALPERSSDEHNHSKVATAIFNDKICGQCKNFGNRLLKFDEYMNVCQLAAWFLPSTRYIHHNILQRAMSSADRKSQQYSIPFRRIRLRAIFAETAAVQLLRAAEVQ